MTTPPPYQDIKVVVGEKAPYGVRIGDTIPGFGVIRVIEKKVRWAFLTYGGEYVKVNGVVHLVGAKRLKVPLDSELRINREWPRYEHHVEWGGANMTESDRS